MREAAEICPQPHTERKGVRGTRVFVSGKTPAVFYVFARQYAPNACYAERAMVACDSEDAQPLFVSR